LNGAEVVAELVLQKEKKKEKKHPEFVRKEESEGYVSKMSLTCGMPMLRGR
jgi:hypothetical protein